MTMITMITLTTTTMTMTITTTSMATTTQDCDAKPLTMQPIPAAQQTKTAGCTEGAVTLQLNAQIELKAIKPL